MLLPKLLNNLFEFKILVTLVTAEMDCNIAKHVYLVITTSLEDSTKRKKKTTKKKK